MKFNGDITVKAPRREVFDALADAEFFASCVEGVRDMQQVDETHYTAVLESKIAYMRFKFKVEVELTRIEPIEVIEAKVEGVPMGVLGRLTGTSLATLEDCEEGTCIKYAMDVALAGKLGSIGQPVLRAKARDMERKFAANLRTAFEESAETGA